MPVAMTHVCLASRLGSWLQMEVGVSMVPGPEDDTGHLAGGQARPSHLACHVPHVLPVVLWHPWLSRPTCPTVVPHPSRPTLAPPLFVHHHGAPPTHCEPPQHGTYVPPTLTPTTLTCFVPPPSPFAHRFCTTKWCIFSWSESGPGLDEDQTDIDSPGWSRSQSQKFCQGPDCPVSGPAKMAWDQTRLNFPNTTPVAFVCAITLHWWLFHEGQHQLMLRGEREIQNWENVCLLLYI